MPTGTITTDGTEQDVFADEPEEATGEVEGSVDLNEMTSSETIVVRLYKAIDGTDDRVLEEETFVGSQAESGVVIGPVAGDPDNAPVRLTVERTDGEDIDIPWEFQRVY